MQIVVAWFVGLLLSVGASAGPGIEGQVRLASGEPAAGAQVALFDLADLRRWIGATADASGRFALALGALPDGFGLGQNYPNPFNPGTVIPYKLAMDGYVRLEVFNLLGQRVATLVDGVQSAGGHAVRWDARDGSGHGVAAGVYVYRLTAEGATATRRMVLVDGPAGAAAGPVRVAGAADAPVYGLVVSGTGLVTYVDAAFAVGGGPVEVVVEPVGLASSGKTAQTERGILGDVDNSDHVDLLDALLVAMYVANPATVLPNGGIIALGDVNGDGAIDITDAWLIGVYSSNPLDTRLPMGIGEGVEIGDEGEGLADVRSLAAALDWRTGQWGFIDAQGTYVIEPQFDAVDFRGFSEGLAAVRIGTVWWARRWGFIDAQGTYVVNPQFDDVWSFSEGLAAVFIGGKWGFIDRQGSYVVNPQFANALPFSEGLAAVSSVDWTGIGKWGFIDRQGSYVVNPQFAHVCSFSEGLAVVWTGDKLGFIDRQGRYVIEPQFDDIDSRLSGSSESALAVEFSGDWADIGFSEGLAAVRIGDKWGFIDRQGTYVIEPQFAYAQSFSEGLAVVRIGDRETGVGKYGFIDRQGRYVVEPQFDGAQSFSEGLAAVRIGDRWGFIDRQGRYVINPQFDVVGSFRSVF